MKRKFRIKDKKFYINDEDCEGSVNVIIRPTIQVKIWGLWFTILEIVNHNKLQSYEVAETILKQLNSN